MKKYFIAPIGLAFIPSIAFAAWWNPTTWFSQSSVSVTASSSETVALTETINQQNTEISQLQVELASTTSQTPTVITKTTTQTVKDPTEEADITSLTQQLAKAQTQYALCQGQLSSASTNTQSATTASATNNAKIQGINEELAALTQIDFDIDNAPLQFNGNNTAVNGLTGTTTLLSVLNSSMRLDGTPLFPNTLGEWYVTATAGLQPTTSTSTLHSTITAYRNALEGQLQSLGAVTNTMNISQ